MKRQMRIRKSVPKLNQTMMKVWIQFQLIWLVQRRVTKTNYKEPIDLIAAMS